ncbi:LuxR C-terminal-related transcriptional regulator [Shewanella sp. 10N.286.51.B2]|uniref:helix-turn-helix transcriptional regulator n=1 Tax=unclassified Shewanella TaxID=196818 RepID=UPI0026E1D52E|nr:MULTISPECIES: helix-turn-helix transcriptional regulator [unclassified Shewanella]MDO6620544.1 helix-turn-helix transcriptional regulator [Shewanella sp. 6_MG-2023]MDO6777492.1 helix-turn-helix transcriptional regulator [Shewanella sp. 3_MG-2023]
MKQSIISNKVTIDSAIERRERLELTLNNEVSRLGFIGGTYILDLARSVKMQNSHIDVDAEVSISKREKRHNFLYSNSAMRKMRADFTKKAIKVEPNMSKLNASGIQIFSYEEDTEASRLCRDVLSKYNVRSRVYYRYQSENCPYLHGRFFFMSEFEPTVLKTFAEQNREQMQQFISNFHNMVLGSEATSEINPFTGLGLISRKSHNVLKMLAEGHSRISISETLHLTERGVDYHVNKMKALFEVKNNSQLVAVAFKYKILS